MAVGALRPIAAASASDQARHGWILEFRAKDDVARSDSFQLMSRVIDLLVKDLKSEKKISLERPIPLEVWERAPDLLELARKKNVDFIVQGTVESVPPDKERRLAMSIRTVSTGERHDLAAATETRLRKLVDILRTHIQGRPFVPEVYFACFNSPTISNYAWQVPNRLREILGDRWRDRFSIVREELVKLDCRRDTTVRTSLNNFDFVVSGDIVADEDNIQASVKVRSWERERHSPQRFRGTIKDGVRSFSQGLGNYIDTNRKELFE